MLNKILNYGLTATFMVLILDGSSEQGAPQLGNKSGISIR